MEKPANPADSATVTNINEPRIRKQLDHAVKVSSEDRAAYLAEFGEFFMMVGEAYFEGEGKEKKEALKALYDQMQAAKQNGTLPPDEFDFAAVVWDLDDPADE